MATKFGDTNNNTWYTASANPIWNFGSGDFTIVFSGKLHYITGNSQYFINLGTYNTVGNLTIYFSDRTRITFSNSGDKILDTLKSGSFSGGLDIVYMLKHKDKILTLDAVARDPETNTLKIYPSADGYDTTGLSVSSNDLYIGTHSNATTTRNMRTGSSISFVAIAKGWAMPTEDFFKLLNMVPVLEGNLGNFDCYWDFSVSESSLVDKVSGVTLSRTGSNTTTSIDSFIPHNDFGGYGVVIDMLKNDKSGRGSVGGVQATIKPVDGSGNIINDQYTISFNDVSIQDGKLKLPFIHEGINGMDEVYLSLYKAADTEPKDDLIFSGRVPIVSDINNI